jgi:hypothetical protein
MRRTYSAKQNRLIIARADRSRQMREAEEIGKAAYERQLQQQRATTHQEVPNEVIPAATPAAPVEHGSSPAALSGS